MVNFVTIARHKNGALEGSGVKMSKIMKFLTAVVCALALTACETVEVINVLDDGFIETGGVTISSTTINPDDPKLVHLNGYSYDLLDRNPDIPRDMRVALNTSSSSWQIVQFTRPLSLDEQNTLIKQYGLSLNKHVRNNAYVEYLTPRQGREIERHELFRARGAYHTAFKLSRTIGQREFVTKERRNEAGIRLVALLWSGADRAIVERYVENNDGRVIGWSDQFNPNRPDKAKFYDPDFSTSRLTIVLPSEEPIIGLARLPQVEWVEEADEVTLSNPQTAAVLQKVAQTGVITIDQPFRNHGLLGDGEVIGHIDGPIDPNNAYFQAPGKIIRHTPAPGAVLGPVVACGTDVGHGTHTAGTAAGGSGIGLTNVGMAPNARLTHTDLAVLNGGTPLNVLLNLASGDGARVHTNSYDVKDTVTPDQYTALSSDVDVFSWNEPYQLVVLSTGNNDFDLDSDGNPDPMPANPPWNSKNGLAVAASSSPPNQMNQHTGGTGPAKGRRKPEIYADGHNVLSAQAGSAAPEPSTACTGSSMATPAIAGGAALIRQYFKNGFYPTGAANVANAFEPSGALVKAVLLNSTRDMTGVDRENGTMAALNGYPTNLEGWGLAVLDDTVYFAGDPHSLNVWDVPRATGIGTGDQTTYNVWVQSNAPRFKVTLAWMDSPPTAGTWGNALMPVNNNLDLIVQAPDGTLYYGNHYGAGAQSAAGGAADKMNNVEQFERSSPQPGPWKIHVRGTNVAQGPLQGYALVASGDLTTFIQPPGGADGMIVTNTSTGVCKSDHYKFDFKQGGAVLDTLKTSELDLPEVYCEVDDQNRHQIIKKPFKSRDKYITFAVAADDKGRSVQLHTIVYTAAAGMQDGVIEISAEPYNSRLVSGSRQLQRISNISISDTDAAGLPCGMACVTFTVSSAVRDITIAGSAFGKDANNDPNAGGRYQVKISNSGAVTAVDPI